MRVDLCTIHELLEKLGYGEEDGVASRTWYVNDFFVSKEMIITRNLRVDVDADSHEYIMYICAYHFSYISMEVQHFVLKILIRPLNYSQR